MGETVAPKRSPGIALTLAVWFAVLLASLTAFAMAVRAQLPTTGLVVAAAAVLLVMWQLSLLRRRASRRQILAVASGGLAVGIIGAILSVHDLLRDSLGFAALGVALYSAVLLVDQGRCALADARPADRRLIIVVTVAAGMAAALLAWLPLPFPSWWSSLAAIVLGAIGIELCSAMYPRLLSDHRVLTAFAGVAVILLMGAFVRLHVELSLAMWIVLAVGLVTALLISSNDTPVVLGVLVLAALWAGVPRTATVPPGSVPRADEDYWVAMGDSFMSGEGADAYYSRTNTTDESEGNECRRAPTAWPMLVNPTSQYTVGAEMGVPDRVLFIACSGARTADIRRTPADDSRDEPEQLDLLEDAMGELGPPRFVVVSVGGNDTQFSAVGTQCILPGDCGTFVEKILASRMEKVGQELARTYAEIRLLVGDDVPVIAAPYPIPAHIGDSCRGVLLSEDDLKQVNEFAMALDEQVQQAAAEAGALYLDTFPGSLRDSAAQLCEPHGQPGLNFANLNPKGGSLWSTLNPKNWTHNFIHPNPRGHRILAAAAMRWLADHRCVLTGETTVAEPCMPEPIDARVRALAGQPPDLPQEISADSNDAIDRFAREALFGAGLLALGWWLLITAMIGWRRDEGVASSFIGRYLDRLRKLLGTPQPPGSGTPGS